MNHYGFDRFWHVQGAWNKNVFFKGDVNVSLRRRCRRFLALSLATTGDTAVYQPELDDDALLMYTT